MLLTLLQYIYGSRFRCTKLSLMTQWHFKMADWTCLLEWRTSPACKVSPNCVQSLRRNTDSICWFGSRLLCLYRGGPTVRRVFNCRWSHIVSCYLTLLPSIISMQRGWLVANQWPWRYFAHQVNGSKAMHHSRPSKAKSDKLLSSKLSNSSTSA